MAMGNKEMLLLACLTLVMFEGVRGLSNENYVLDTSFMDQLCDSSFISFEATMRSFLECATLCTKHQDCGSLIVHAGNDACFGINSELACFGHSSTLQGARYYRPPTGQQCSEELVSGPYGVTDDKITASSLYDLGIIYNPEYGRLNNNIHWGVGTLDNQQYIQVDFTDVRVITDVITQGGIYSGHSHWVTSYKFLYSIDCVTYTTIKDSNAQDKVFQANSDGGTHVTNTLASPVLARCVRLNPRTWNQWACMRLGVLGCLYPPAK